MNAAEIEDIELQLLLQAVFLKYKYDFRAYSRSSLHGRLMHLMQRLKLPTLTALQDRLLHDENLWGEFLPFLIVATTEFFRNPSYYKALREQVVPQLARRSQPSIWIAGCSTGEEVFSMAILLKEEGLLERTRIVASDINPMCIEKAQRGVFSKFKAQEGTKNYLESGGKGDFASYYAPALPNASAPYGSPDYIPKDAVRFDPSLLANVMFANHNLAADGPIAQFDFVSCRNVLCYFDVDLQARAMGLFRASLLNGGVLGLGAMEPLPDSPVTRDFSGVNQDERLFACAPKTSGYGPDYLP